MSFTSINDSPGYKASEDRVTQAIVNFQPANETQSVLSDKLLLAWFRLRRARAHYWGLPLRTACSLEELNTEMDKARREERAASRSFYQILEQFRAARTQSVDDEEGLERTHLPSSSAVKRA